MGTYVQLTKAELEDWLNTIQHLHKKWHLKHGTVGVYVLPLSDNVAVELSSTIGGEATVMNKARASMQLRLVSTATGRVLNKKAQGQDHFKRTVNWKTTWAKGIEVFRLTYLKSADFYERLAVLKPGESLDDAPKPAHAPAAPAPAVSAETEAQLARMRNLYRAAQAAQDSWLIEFLTNVGQALKAGRPLSEKQQAVLDKSYARHRVGNLVSRYLASLGR